MASCIAGSFEGACPDAGQPEPSSITSTERFSVIAWFFPAIQRAILRDASALSGSMGGHRARR